MPGMLAHTTLIAVLHGVEAGMEAIHLRTGPGAEAVTLHRLEVEAVRARLGDGMVIRWT